MLRRRLLGFVLMLGALGLAVFGLWLLERHETGKEADDAAAAKLIGFRPASVRDVVLENQNGRFVLTRDGGGWKITEPVALPADAGVVDALVTAVADVSRTRLVEIDGKPPVASEVGMFGLAPPRAQVSLAGDDGTKVLEIGKKNDFNGEIYARVRGSDAVAMIGSGIEFQIAKDLFDLRDKRLLAFEPAQVERLDVIKGEHRLYGIVRENGKNKLLLDGGRSVEADPVQVSGIMTALSTLRATRFLEEHATEAARKALGLMTPGVLHARLTLTSGATQSLAIVHSSDGDRWLAMREGDDAPIAEISGDWLAQKLDVDPKTLRDMRVVDFNRDEIAGIMVSRSGETVALALHEGVWRAIAGAPAEADVSLPHEADASRCSGLLYKLYGLRAESVLSESATEAVLQDSGLGAPSLTVELKKADGSTAAKLLVATDAQGRTTATQVGRGRIDLIGASEVADISAKVADYLPAEAQAKK